jgi:hypothetical protein
MKRVLKTRALSYILTYPTSDAWNIIIMHKCSNLSWVDEMKFNLLVVPSVQCMAMC